MVYFSIIFIFSVILLIGLSILLYRVLYKRSLNNTLHGGNRSFLMEPIHFIFSIFFVIILVMLIITQSKLNDLQNKIDNRHNYLNQELMYIRSQYSDIVDKYDELIDQNRWIMDSSYQLMGFTEDSTKQNVQLNFSIREKIPQSTLFILVVNKEDETDWQKIELDNNGYLTFVETIPLDLLKNYTIYLKEEAQNKESQEKLFDILMKERFKTRSKIDGRVENNQYYFTIIVDNYNNPNFLIKKVSIRIASESGITDPIDYTNEVTISEISTGSHQQRITGTYPIESIEQEEIIFILEDYLGNELIVIDGLML